MSLRERLRAVRILWRNYIAGYRLGLAESRRDGAAEELAEAYKRYDQSRIAVVKAEDGQVRALMATGMTYQEACERLGLHPSPLGELVAHPEACEAVGRAAAEAFSNDRSRTKVGPESPRASG